MKIKTRHDIVVDLDKIRKRWEAYDHMSPDMSGVPRHDTELTLIDIIRAILELPRWHYVDSAGMMPFPGKDDGGGDYIDRTNIIAILEHGTEKLAEFQALQEMVRRLVGH